MIRKEWKSREDTKNTNVNLTGHRGRNDEKMDEDEDDDDDDDDDEQEEAEAVVDEDGTEEDGEMYEIDEDDESADLEATPRMLPRTTGINSPQSSVSTLKPNNRHARRQTHQRANKHANNADVEGLADSLDSLSLVPTSIRFGRGKTAGFVPNQRGSRGRGGRGGSGGPQIVNTRGTDGFHPRGTGYRGGGRGGGQATSTTGTAEVPSWTPRERGRGRGRQAPRGVGRGRGY